MLLSGVLINSDSQSQGQANLMHVLIISSNENVGIKCPLFSENETHNLFVRACVR